MGAVALVATVASTIASVAGTVMSAMSQQRAAAYQSAIAQRNAQIARNNQTVMENNAKATEAAGAARADQEAMQTRELIGKQRAGAAASGLDLGSGTPVDITSGTAGLGMWSGLNIRDETNRRAAGYRQQGANYAAQGGNFDAQAAAASDAGDSALLGGMLGAGGELFKGLVKTEGLLGEFQRTGVRQFDLATKLK